MERIEVVSPAGGESIAPRSTSSRLDSLDGKTIGEIWNGVFKGDQTFPVIRRLLKQRYPRIKIVPYTEFPFLHTGDDPRHQMQLARDLAALAKGKGCDAVISGNGA